MAEKDFIGSPVTVKKTLVFDQKALYKHLKKAFKDKGYSVKESDYDEGFAPDGSKTVSFSWNAGKKASAYVRMNIAMDFSSSFRDVKVAEGGKEKTAQKGSVALEFRGFLKKDPESDWELNERKPLQAFFRELYDKIVKRDQHGEMSDDMESDMKKIIDSAKLFLKMRRYD